MGAALETRYRTERELRFGAFPLIQRSSWWNSGKPSIQTTPGVRRRRAPGQA